MIPFRGVCVSEGAFWLRLATFMVETQASGREGLQPGTNPSPALPPFPPRDVECGPETRVSIDRFGEPCAGFPDSK